MKKLNLVKFDKPHKHRFQIDVADCPNCGLGRYFVCSCGEVREEDKNGKPSRKTFSN